MGKLIYINVGQRNTKHIIDIPNFPKDGVVFRDITPLLSTNFLLTIKELANLIPDSKWQEINSLVGIESRGFILASGLAIYLNKNLTLIRKKGKLPPPVISKSYQLEYGVDNLEIKPGTGNVLVIDDVLATEGTFSTAAALCKEAGYNVKGFLTLLNLQYLNNFEWNNKKLYSLINYKKP